jgi:ABC-type multidrug transport system fused ATPase/permease subunit
MLNQATWHVLRSPMSLLDTTPLGRITHRFTKDIDVMDMSLTDSLRMYLVLLSIIIGVFLLTIAYFYYVRIRPSLYTPWRPTLIPFSLPPLLCPWLFFL